MSHMPRLPFQEPTGGFPGDDDAPLTHWEAVPCDGQDAGAAHRERMRAATTARQEEERRAAAQRAAGCRVREARRALALRPRTQSTSSWPRTFSHRTRE